MLQNHRRQRQTTKNPQCVEACGFWGVLRLSESMLWSLRQESNLYLTLRRRPFYPLNYGEAFWAEPVIVRCPGRDIGVHVASMRDGINASVRIRAFLLKMP